MARRADVDLRSARPVSDGRASTERSIHSQSPKGPPNTQSTEKITWRGLEGSWKSLILVALSFRA